MSPQNILQQIKKLPLPFPSESRPPPARTVRMAKISTETLAIPNQLSEQINWWRISPYLGIIPHAD